MSDARQLPLSVQPVISYPREAQVGKTYLMTIDLQPSGDGEWLYEEEEYPIYCMLDTSLLFSSKPVGEPAVVLHRFGGSYGAAKFLLTATQEEMEGEIKVTLVNGWGVPIKVITIDNIKITQKVNRTQRIIGEHEREATITQTTSLEEKFQKSLLLGDTQKVADLDELTVLPKEGVSGTAEPIEISDERISQEELIRSAPDIHEVPCLSLAIARLSNAGEENFAISVLKAPYPGGYVLHHTAWSPAMTETWLAWQEMYSLRALPHVPLIHHASQSARTLPPDSDISAGGQTTSYSSRLMQRLGIDLWAWLFDGPIRNALAQSQGIAIGQNELLRLRLEIRDPDFIPLPWEIMQPMAGKQAISLSQQLLFSRTTSDVDVLKPVTQSNQALNILMVLGQDATRSTAGSQLEQEAAALANVLKACGQPNPTTAKCVAPFACNVETLLQPTPAELIDVLEDGTFNILFYAGHGEPGTDGGLLFLRTDAVISGTKLAQVLVRTQVTLAVFNACWGTQPEQVGSQSIGRSSLAEVLIQHGFPAVLGMRDLIADQEALTFIETLTQALAARMPIDQAVALARQQLLTIYKFNQPAWTLPVLYMHPQFEGELIKPIEEGITELPPMTPSWVGTPVPVAYLRALGTTAQVWRIRGGLMRVGRRQENDLVIQEQWVSQQHAEIICRDDFNGKQARPTYFLRDFSRYGTLILPPDRANGAMNQEIGGRDGVPGWQRIHHEEVPLQSGIQLKFGSSQGQILEFLIESSDSSG